MTPDRINAVFEYVGVAAALFNSFALIWDNGNIAGVSITSQVFFTLWGFWNLYYYPHLGQRASAIAAFALVLANCTWLMLVLAYRTGVL